MLGIGRSCSPPRRWGLKTHIDAQRRRTSRTSATATPHRPADSPSPDALVPDTHDYLVDAVFNPTFAESYKVAALDVMNKMRTLSRFRA